MSFRPAGTGGSHLRGLHYEMETLGQPQEGPSRGTRRSGLCAEGSSGLSGMLTSPLIIRTKYHRVSPQMGVDVGVFLRSTCVWTLRGQVLQGTGVPGGAESTLGRRTRPEDSQTRRVLCSRAGFSPAEGEKSVTGTSGWEGVDGRQPELPEPLGMCVTSPVTCGGSVDCHSPGKLIRDSGPSGVTGVLLLA